MSDINIDAIALAINDAVDSLAKGMYPRHRTFGAVEAAADLDSDGLDSLHDAVIRLTDLETWPVGQARENEFGVGLTDPESQVAIIFDGVGVVWIDEDGDGWNGRW